MKKLDGHGSFIVDLVCRNLRGRGRGVLGRAFLSAASSVLTDQIRLWRFWCEGGSGGGIRCFSSSDFPSNLVFELSGTSMVEVKPRMMNGKNSIEIPVFSTLPKVTTFSPSSNGNDSGSSGKPLSLWPGMYHSPVTTALWNARSTIYERPWTFNLEDDGAPAQTNLVMKTPAMSRITICYNFSSDVILREQYRNSWNGVRIGKLLEDMDALAGTIAMKHCADDDHTTRPLMLVTASVDKIKLRKPLLLDVDITCSGVAAWVGRSSMEIQIQISQSLKETDSDEDGNAMVANFTFVARDKLTRKAALVNRLNPETEFERKLFAEGEARAGARRDAPLNAKSRKASDRTRVEALLAEGRLLQEMPTLADRNSLLIRDTKMENAIVCQPQQRNLHGRIFGGYLMRVAYELAYSTCYVFAGSRPVFIEVDHVDFLRPVDVGDLLRFKSCVLYTENEELEHQIIHVEVVSHVIQPETRSTEISNTFYFTFTLDVKDVSLPVFKVFPSTEAEANAVVARYNVEHVVSD